MPSSFFKIFSGLALIASPARALIAEKPKPDFFCQNDGICHAELPPPLPAECKSFEVIKGDPLTAKVLLMGERHMSKTCTEEQYSCTKALTTARNTKNPALLFELYGHDKRLLCEEMGYQDISTDCHGWNIAQEEHAKKDFSWKAAELEQFHIYSQTLLNSSQTDPTAIQRDRDKAAFALKKRIASDKEHLKKFEKRYHIFMEKIGNKHSNVYTKTIDTIKKGKFNIAIAENMLKEIEENKKSLHEICDSIRLQKNSYEKIRDDYVKDADASLREPHKALIKTISHASSRKKLVIAYGGNAHFKAIEKYGKDQGQAVQELYNDLERFADTNPYAVLAYNPKR